MRSMLIVSIPVLLFAGYRLASSQKTPAQDTQELQKSVQNVSPKTRKPPDQPRCSGVPLPDIEIHEVGLGTAEGLSSFEWHPGETYEVYVEIINRGQCETGAFGVELLVKLAVPSAAGRVTPAEPLSNSANEIPLEKSFPA